MKCCYCDIRKRYGLTGKCITHRTDIQNKCNKCTEDAKYGFEYHRATRCYEHKTRKMILKGKLCECCARKANYGYIGSKGSLRCDMHIENGMILLN